MAVVHPLAFILRRVLFSFVIVLMVGDKVLFGTILLLLTCLFMLCFVAAEAQWEDNLINVQHFVNEVVLYVIFASLMCFSGVLTKTKESAALGWLIIGLIFSFVIFNIVVIFFDLCMFIRLLIKRYRHKMPRRLQAKSKTKKP